MKIMQEKVRTVKIDIDEFDIPIPDEFLLQLDWKEGDTIKVDVKNGQIILTKVED